MKLRPYHNPENIDESLVPKGWRFRYADELTAWNNEARFLQFVFPAHLGLKVLERDWRQTCEGGRHAYITYIVPVDA